MQVQQFVQCIGGASSLYGLCEETVDSLLLTILPFEFKLHMADRNMVPLQQLPSTDNFENAHQKQIYILQVLTDALKLNFNFRYQEVCDLYILCGSYSILLISWMFFIFISAQKKKWSVMQNICSS